MRNQAAVVFLGRRGRFASKNNTLRTCLQAKELRATRQASKDTKQKTSKAQRSKVAQSLTSVYRGPTYMCSCQS